MQLYQEAYETQLSARNRKPLLRALEFSDENTQDSSLENVFGNSKKGATVLPLANRHYVGFFLEALAPLLSIIYFSDSQRAVASLWLRTC